MFSLDLLELHNQRGISYVRCFRRRFGRIGFLYRSPFQLRIFQLLTDSHTFACPHKFGQIGVKSVMGKSRQFNSAVYAALSASQRNTENFRRLHGIFAENFIEIADTEHENCIRMFLFHLLILFEQWLIPLLNLLGKRFLFRRFRLDFGCRRRCWFDRVRRRRLNTVGIIQFQI